MQTVFLGTYSAYSADGYPNGAPQTLADALCAIRDLGYDGVELLAKDLRENDPAQIRAALRESGLQCVSAHIDLDEMEPLMERCAAVGLRYLITSGTAMETREDALAVAAQMNALGQKAAKYGMKVGYHSHHSDFWICEGKALYEILLEHTDPETTIFQLDCGWAAAAGVWAPSFLRRYPGRFPILHVKENSKVLGPDFMSKSPEGKQRFIERAVASYFPTQCRLGAPESNLDYRQIVQTLQEQGCTPYLVVEREYTYAGTRLDCLREDCAWLKANL